MLLQTSIAPASASAAAAFTAPALPVAVSPQLDSYAIQLAFSTLRREQKLRHRDIAAHLQLSEGQLIAAHVGAEIWLGGAMLAAVRLESDWAALIASLEPLGEVLALTRNDSCVHEKTGVYRRASHYQQVGLVLGGEIDLRVFYRQWAHGFAVTEHGDNAIQHSLQFFDAAGTAIHKIFLQPQSDVSAYDALVLQFAALNQSPGMARKPRAAGAPEKPDAAIDVAGFRAAWASLRDTHDFFDLLKQFSVSRTQGLRLAESRFVQRVDKESVLDLLNDAVRESVAIMAFVGNPGMIQIHTGPIDKIAVLGNWINVLDPRFSLHLREDHIASAWVVRKPTVDGLVTSLELFDAHGETILMLFGARKPGARELCEWRALIDKIVEEYELCAS